MKKLSLLLLLLLTVFFAVAQQKQIDTARLAISKATTDTDKYIALNRVGNLYSQNHPDSALIFHQQGFLLAKRNNWVLNQAKILSNIGGDYVYIGDYVKGTQNYLRALKIYEGLHDLAGIANVNLSIGFSYYMQHDLTQGLAYTITAKKGLETYALTHKLTSRQGRTYTLIYDNMGGFYFEKYHNLDSAEKYLNISYEMAKKAKYDDLLGDIQDFLGKVAAARGKNAEAARLFRQALESNRLVGDADHMCQAYVDMAGLYHKSKQQDSAEYYGKKALETAESGHLEQDALEAAKVLYTYYDEDHNLPEAYKYFKITTAAKDSLYSQDKVKQLLSLDFDEKERLQEIETAKTENRNTVRFYMLLGGLAVLLLLVVIFWYANKQRKKAYKLLQRQKQETDLQRTKVEHTLDELKATQTQLVQSYNSVSVLSQIGKEITSTLNLDTILNTVYEKVNELMEASVFGIGIFIPEEQSIDYRMAIEDGKRYTPYRRKMDNKNQLPVWCIENNKEVFINNVHKEYTNYISEYAEVNNARLDDGSRFKSPVSLIYLPLTVEEKVIGLITVQSFRENAYTHQHLDILKTLASYTSAALYNANSFQTLQTTVNELQLTQKQLIQSEKMASLGELTAGIAHEIQNPLNFVNNFSEVNTELISEVKREIEKGDLDEIKALIINIDENSKKINMHGKRADSIVKGMLQHSQSGNGAKELVNINATADEYMRLAYHGLRSKDKSFNAELITNFDEKLPKVNVIPQDMGRVFLNLFNNAFYAVNQKRKSYGADYKPEVSVITYGKNGSVVIKVTDNGIGIPDVIKDKIMQPFFTTKPTGEGTGLGLSLTYDMVVKGHGGSIQVNSVEGEGSEFVISLPSH